MALSGSFTGTTANSYITPKIVWASTQDVAGNWTRVTAILSYAKSSGSSQATSGTWSGGITINGTRTSGTKSNVVLSPGGSEVTVLTAQTYVYHDTDGTKKITISADGSIAGSSMSSTTISKTDIELDRIPRISQSTLSATSVEFGESVKITTNRVSTAFTHKLFYKYGSSGWIAITSTPSVTTDYTWTVPKDLMTQIPNESSLSITISCDTYYNGTYLGEHHTVLTATIPLEGYEYYPSIGSISWERDANTPEPESWGLVQNVSKGKINIKDAAGAYGSTVKFYSLTFAGLSSTASSLTVENISSSGTLKAVAKVTDSRGRSLTKEVNFTVSAYSPPTLSVEVYRCGSSGSEDASGDYLSVKATVSITKISDNAVKSLIFYYKKSTDTAYSQQDLTSGTAKIISASSNNTWDWYVAVSDKVNTVNSNGSAPTGDVVLDILASGKGIAFGKVAEKEGFDSAWPFMLNGVVQPHINPADYIVEQGTQDKWTYRKWNSGLAECWGNYLFATTITNAWGYIYEATAANNVTFPSWTSNGTTTYLFTGDPDVWPNVIWTNGYGILSLEVLGRSTKEKSFDWYPLRATPTDGSMTYWCQVYARGKWK